MILNFSRVTALCFLLPSFLLGTAYAEEKAKKPAATKYTKPVEGPELDGLILPPGSPVYPYEEFETSVPPDLAFGAYQRGFYLTALKLALPRAESGDPAAQTLIAELYRRGLGVGRDPAKAAEWYQIAANAGNREAQFSYANMLVRGDHIEKDKTKGEKFMRLAADSGHIEAQFNLAQIITSNRPTWAGFEKALPYYTKAAEGGILDAQYALANIYAEAKGVLYNDDIKARQWLKKAALGGFDTAQVEFALWAASGRGHPKSEKNIKLAHYWFTRAAAQGNVIAQNRLGHIFAFGIGTDRDVIKGCAWHILARRAGYSDSKLDQVFQNLPEIDKKRAIEGANQLAKRTGS